MSARTLEGAAESDCPMCAGRGVVESFVNWVPFSYKADLDCEWCGGSGKLPIFQKELLDE